jgi:hypothetical protein
LVTAPIRGRWRLGAFMTRVICELLDQWRFESQLTRSAPIKHTPGNDRSRGEVRDVSFTAGNSMS